MTTASDSPQTLERRHPTEPRRRHLRWDGTLEIEAAPSSDPARTARIIATLVNNSPMALTQVTADGQTAYPVPSTAVSPDGHMLLTLRMRHRGQHLDSLLVAEIVELVSTMCHVVGWRRRP